MKPGKSNGRGAYLKAQCRGAGGWRRREKHWRVHLECEIPQELYEEAARRCLANEGSDGHTGTGGMRAQKKRLPEKSILHAAAQPVKSQLLILAEDIGDNA